MLCLDQSDLVASRGGQRKENHCGKNFPNILVFNSICFLFTHFYIFLAITIFLFVCLSPQAFYFAGASLLTYACAAIFSLTMEYPLVGLEKLFIPRN